MKRRKLVTLLTATKVSSGYQGVRYLDPKEIQAWYSDTGSLTITINNKEIYERVKIFRSQPLTSPDKYISLRIGETKADQKEVGIIPDLNQVEPASREVLTMELDKRYFFHIITKIVSIKEQFEFLYWKVETNKGPMEFSLPGWAHSQVVTLKNGGKLIIDVNGNRYIIPDFEKLDLASQTVFKGAIYW